MNYVNKLSIALLVICAVPAAFAADDKKVRGYAVGGKFYADSAVRKATDEKKVDVHYIIGEDCKWHEVDKAKPTEFTIDEDGKYVTGNEAAIEAGKSPKYAVGRHFSFNGKIDIDPSFFFKVNKKFHNLGDWTKKGVKAAFFATPVALGVAAYHLSPAAKKKMNQLYANVSKLLNDAKDGDKNALMKATALVAGLGAAGYVGYTYGDDAFYTATMIDKNYFDAYKAA